MVRLDPGVESVDDALALLAESEGPSFLVADGRSYALLVDPDPDRLAAAKPADRTPAWWALDASVASIFVLESLLGVSDAAGQVEAEHDPAAALRLAERDGGIALFLKPAPSRASSRSPRPVTPCLASRPCSCPSLDRAWRCARSDSKPESRVQITALR